MRRLIPAVAAAAAMLSAGLPAHSQSQPMPAGAFGVWSNPHNTVHIEIKPCASGGACGTVVWATPKAQADAREAGTASLIGLQIFRNLEQDAKGVWRGKVFVPDMNRSFSGTAEPLDGAKLKAKGCLIGGFLCKSQVWKRIA